jgi:uncharacterized protein YjbI with pentapeptide repeats
MGEQPSWTTCDYNGCLGSRIANSTWCLAHAEEETLDAELQRISAAEGSVDARGVTISAELLRRILDAAPCEDDRPVLMAARFERATFEGRAGFEGVRFQGLASFDGASFEGVALFDGASFEGEASFHRASFQKVAIENDRPSFRTARFERATFKGRAGFEGVRFQGETEFGEASFEGLALFTGASFQSGSRFDRASFQNVAHFIGATLTWAAFTQATFQAWARFDMVRFKGSTFFNEASFQSGAQFEKASFEDRVRFIEVSFQGEARFNEASFQGEADFAGVTFQRGARFLGATFQNADFSRTTFYGEAGLGGVTFQRGAKFDGATFELARQLGPVVLGCQLSLEAATFKERVQIEAAAAIVRADRARFLAGGQLRLRWAQVVLDDADLAVPIVLAGVPKFRELNEDQENQVDKTERALEPEADPDDRPRLLSVRRADVAGVTLDNVDLRACRFLGAHNLDKLRIERNCEFGSTPHRGGTHSGGWTTRDTIAEEQHWRSTEPQPPYTKPRSRRRINWYGPEHDLPPWLGAEKPPPAAQIAELYRALRKGREDSKDEPGAADFYYGEMDMRREARDQQAKDAWCAEPRDWGTWVAARSEHAILWLYWAVSGYALRAWRALIFLLAVLLIASVLIALVGFPSRAETALTGTASGTPPRQTVRLEPARDSSITTQQPFGARLGTATLIALEGAVFRASELRLTYKGRLIQTAIRFIGPVLLALAVLSIRGRIKR